MGIPNTVAKVLCPVFKRSCHSWHIICFNILTEYSLNMEKIKLLIVEDNKLDQTFYDHSLSESIFEKRLAENGTKALKVYEDWKPDIILLDLMLPEESGYNVLKNIRDKHEDQSTTIIIAPSLSDGEDIRQCAKYVIQGYLVKPIKPKEFNEKILKLHSDRHRKS